VINYLITTDTFAEMNIEKLYSIYKENPVVCTDSRAITKNCLFFALKGENFNGNLFAGEALKLGASYVVVDEKKFVTGDRCVLVEDVLQTLQQLAKHHRRALQIPVIAITGSNGKTTTKELIRNVLSKKYKTSATKGNLNNHIGVPLTILSIEHDAEMAVIEMGANHLDEIKILCEIAEPDYGIITNVGKAHLEGFGGFEGVKKGKGEMYDFLAKKGGTVFLDKNNSDLMTMADQRKITKRITYGTGNETDCMGELLSASPFVKIKWTYKDRKGEISSQLIGAYNFENILAAVCIGNYFEVEKNQLQKAIEEYIPDNSRSQVIMKGSNKIILDAYNANPTSVTAALKNFAKMQEENKIVILGQMAELGDESDHEHQVIVNLIEKLQFPKVYLVGNYFLQPAEKKEFIWAASAEQLLELLKETNIHHSTILIKGSRSMKMEKVTEVL
jgi:UDP-N-acetylmuramoyl-tripeptide--D-alanyl-D-alanine ligase